MNKTSRDKKISARRLIALLLCCLCLLTALPIAALADVTDDEPELTLDAVVPEEAPLADPDLTLEEEPALTFYDRLVTAQCCGDIYALLAADENQADVLALTGDQLQGVLDHALALGDDGYLADVTDVLDALVVQPDGEAEEPQLLIDEEVEDEYEDESDEDDYYEESYEEEDEWSDQDAADELYWRLMDCESCEEIYDVLDNADLDEIEALDYDQLTALIDYVCTLEDDGYQEDLIFDLTALRDNETVDLDKGDQNKPGEGDQKPGGGGNELDQSRYNSSAKVYYDTMTYNESTKKGSVNTAARNYISSVVLNTTDVTQADSGNTSNASGGTSLGTYFPTATTASEQETTLTITPIAGYYVTHVVVACVDNSGDPYKCNTWSAGNAFSMGFTVGTSGEVKVDISSKHFSHTSGASKYFILIAVAPIPSPLYVEYWPGDITERSNDSVFSDSDAWTESGTGNYLGSIGEVQTNYTQFMYKYSTDSTEAASWKHYANSITDNAKEAAAAVGYYFTGWKVEYYTKCDAASAGSTDRAYDYEFSNSYGTGSAQPGDDVRLTTNCKIIAQWAPITLKVTKEVSGLANTEFDNTDHNYTIQVQKLNDEDWVDYGDPLTLTVNGDGSASEIISCVAPGTYKVVETGNYDLTGTTTNAYCTTTYTVGEVTVSANGTVQELKVKNTYSDEPATATITVTKQVTGNMLSSNDEFSFTVYVNDVEGTSKAFTLKDGESQELTVNVGDKITITEATGNYATTYQVGGGQTVTGNSVTISVEGNETITFTNEKTVTLDTGVLLDTLPYIIILVVVAAGAVLMLKKRSRRED